ncbi:MULTISPECIES: type II secretion system minor pseudopilin GspI [Marinobacter]|jgi:general secretion pathway protein I|uniref:type II secretion system minor pseudopilin GspI n=1 Tax=Marinobacter TaxID=2742 RepID=UPI002003EDB5|nr:MULTISPECIES: type II secretion system minor pseudopilin GspI [Marinobacter]MCK7550220.1 type II secretion system minor pseudopilin GspI [Marinobacter goseongensis]MDV3503758.1 type II secretion system minor pseudopilin GspI [Marinobacter sp. M-5]
MNRQRGFTLIEVLVALLVFGLIATAAAEVGSQYIASFERIRDKTFAGWIADNRINELRLSEALPGISENSSDLDYGPFRWQVTTAVLATEEPTMRRVEVTVARFRDNGSDPLPVHTLSAFIGES